VSKILDTNPELVFHLKQQQLIELIKKGDITQALEFAQDELAPRGEENVRPCVHTLGSALIPPLAASLFGRVREDNGTACV
jgi:hypothetical protein